MSNDITIFNFDQAEIRVVLDEQGKPWFVAKDVAVNVLGMAVAKDLARRIPERMKDGRSVPTPGGVQEMLCINEPGLFMAVMKSGKPEAEPFCEWIAEEVLPAIRKTGQYRIPDKPMTLLELFQQQAEMFKMQVDLNVEIERKQLEMKAEQERQAAIQAEHDQAIAKITAKQSAFEEGLQYFTVLGYAAYKGITVDLGMAQKIGIMAKQMSEYKGLPIDRVKDQRFGHVNSYHESVLDAVIAEYLS